MAGRRIAPPWDYLHDASTTSLESFELSRLSHAANMRREITALLDQWIEDSAQALLARWVREDRALPREQPSEIAPQTELPFAEPHAIEQSTARPEIPARRVTSVKLSRRRACAGPSRP